MRTNIVLNDELVAEAFKYSDATTKRDLVNQALKDFITHHKRKNMLDLVGKVKISDDYDYKALRQTEKN
ncbi:MAG: type II toxin-antitoxin system VapB family antitoxin [Mariprofundus sp.]|nr:type II toxin-antitoxin system VapB family antitoxin [Mariprofundus sp.]